MSSLIAGGAVVWIALLILGLTLCRAAARGDRNDRALLRRGLSPTTIQTRDQRRVRVVSRRGPH
jgi:hypothetical protein